MDGDAEANLAYYCLHRLHILPSEMLSLPRRERAFLMAAIEVYAEAQREKEKEINDKAKVR